MYDIIGDIHGCYDELVGLLAKLGYNNSHLERKAVFVGDFGDRGPNSSDVLKLVMKMVEDGTGLAVLGNHDDKLWRYLKGNDIKINNGLQGTIDQLKCADIDLDRLKCFLGGLPTQLMLDDDKLLISHAGLKEEYHGVHNKKARAKALYGEATGENDAEGYPVRRDWASSYSGIRTVVHGHVRGDEVRVKNNVYNIDTSCVYGGKLTALQYPELNIVSVDAQDTYWRG